MGNTVHENYTVKYTRALKILYYQTLEDYKEKEKKNTEEVLDMRKGVK